MNKKYLSYFWDYQITKPQLKKILINRADESSRIWALSRILESAPFTEVWEYVSLDELKKIFPRLRLKSPIKEAWERAFRAWE